MNHRKAPLPAWTLALQRLHKGIDCPRQGTHTKSLTPLRPKQLWQGTIVRAQPSQDCTLPWEPQPLYLHIPRLPTNIPQCSPREWQQYSGWTQRCCRVPSTLSHREYYSPRKAQYHIPKMQPLGWREPKCILSRAWDLPLWGCEKWHCPQQWYKLCARACKPRIRSPFCLHTLPQHLLPVGTQAGEPGSSLSRAEGSDPNLLVERPLCSDSCIESGTPLPSVHYCSHSCCCYSQGLEQKRQKTDCLGLWVVTTPPLRAWPPRLGLRERAGFLSISVQHYGTAATKSGICSLKAAYLGLYVATLHCSHHQQQCVLPANTNNSVYVTTAIIHITPAAQESKNLPTCWAQHCHYQHSSELPGDPRISPPGPANTGVNVHWPGVQEQRCFVLFRGNMNHRRAPLSTGTLALVWSVI